MMGVFVYQDVSVGFEVVVDCPGGGVEALDEAAAVGAEVFDSGAAADHVDLHLDVRDDCDEDVLDGVVAVEELEGVVG